jgi:transposase
MRKSHSKDFKAKVALEAIRNESSIQELGQKYDVHPNQISQWKKQLTDNVGELFERPNKKKKNLDDTEQKESELYKNIGQLQVENQFLKKKYKEIYGKDPD